MNENEASAIGRAGGEDDEPVFAGTEHTSPFPPTETPSKQDVPDDVRSLGRSGVEDDEPDAALPSAMTSPERHVTLPEERKTDANNEKADDSGSVWLTTAFWIVFIGVLSWIGFQIAAILQSTFKLPFLLRWPAITVELALIVLGAVWLIRVAGFLVGFRKHRDETIYKYYERLKKSKPFADEIAKWRGRSCLTERLKDLDRLSHHRDNYTTEWKRKRDEFEEWRKGIADETVKQYSILIAVKTATSPWKIVDILAVFYNSTRMVERIARLYGQSCNGPQAFRLVCRWTFNLYVAGKLGDIMEQSADMTVEKAVDLLENQGDGFSWLGSLLPVTGKLFAKAGEGAVNYYLCCRLGRAAVAAFAPDCTAKSPQTNRSPRFIWPMVVAVLFVLWLVVAGLFEVFHSEGKESEQNTSRRASIETPTKRDALPGIAFETPPGSPALLDEAGHLALFAGLTEADAAWNEAQRRADPETPMIRNSLFLRVRKEDGTEVWRQLLTTGSDWRVAEASDGWCRDRAKDLRDCLSVERALLHPDKRHVWMICDPHTYTYAVLCIYDWRENTLRVVADGHSLTLEPDGSILVKGRKTYLYDDNGDSLGAAWFDEWRAPDGTVLRKTEPTPSPDIP